VRAKAATHAVCCETLKCAPPVQHTPGLHVLTLTPCAVLSVIQALCADAGLLPSPDGEAASKRQRRAGESGGADAAAGPVDAASLYVAVYELLFGDGGCDDDGVAAQHAAALRAALQRRLRSAGATSPAQLLPAHVAAASAAAASRSRCVRVNALRCTPEDALASLTASLGAGSVTRDALLPDVLHLPPGTDLRSHALTRSGALILQGRASCLAAHCLAPQPGWTVVDACAAPGNKTTHCAALMAGRGRVFAFDASAPRLQRLIAASRAAGAEGVITARCADFLALDPAQPPLSRAHAVLLDPSCSGSGTGVTRGDALLPSAAGAEQEAAGPRVAALARFQLAALRHALRCPSALRVTYSTCSVHVAENEGVVAAALPHATAAGFTLAPALPAWPRRGVAGGVAGLAQAQAACLLRADPLLDDCEGFFVALFVRDSPPGEPKQAPVQAVPQQQQAPPRWVGGAGKQRKGKRSRPLFA
jgi:putative methyltransferase